MRFGDRLSISHYPAFASPCLLQKGTDMKDHTSSNVIHDQRADWAEQQLMRRCRVNASAARLVGELAGIQAASRSIDEIVQRALVRLAITKRGAR